MKAWFAELAGIELPNRDRRLAIVLSQRWETEHH
jgi:hypothetical protein